MVFEEESSSSDEDTNNKPHEDYGQEDPNELYPDQKAPEELDPDKFNSQKFDLDAVVTLAAAMFTPKTSFLEARSLRRSRPNKLGRPDPALHQRTVAVLDALAYVSVNGSSPAVAIGLTMKPLQLVVTTNKEIPSPTIVKHLNTICSTLKNMSDAKFCICSDPNPSDADLQEELPDPDFFDENLESYYNNLFLQIYKYSYDKLQTKHQKRWKVLEGFAK